MTHFDDRKKAFEGKYALDEEISFKINARMLKMLGHWAAERMGKPDAEAYAKEVVVADFDAPGDDDVIAKLLGDFAKAGHSVTEKDIRVEMLRCQEEARRQIMGVTD